MKSAIVEFLDLLLQPTGLLWLALLAGGLWQWRAKQRLSAVITFTVALLFSIVGGTPLPKYLVQTLEKPYAQQRLDALSEADAVLVLGGFTDRSDREPTGIHLEMGTDRWTTGVELVRRGKARKLVLGGGSHIVGGNVVSEADQLIPLIQRWNLLRTPVLKLPVCTNTRDEAVALVQMMQERGWKRVLLVTSAWHLKRAEAVFRSTGAPVIPIGCDYRSYPEGENRLLEEWPIVPQPKKLKLAEDFTHEWIGWWYYKARGWIKDT